MKNQMNLVALVVLAAFACAGMAQIASAGPVLAVDFQAGASTQSGFTAVTTTTPPAISGFTLSFATDTGAIAFFDRSPAVANNPPMTYGALYSDFVYNNTGGSTITLSISSASILAGDAYYLTLYSYDSGISQPTTTTFTPKPSTTTGPVGTVSYTTANPTSNPQYATTIRVTSLSGGLLEVLATGFATSNQAAVQQALRINGLELRVVPEPSSAFLAMLGLCGIVRCARHRKMLCIE